VFSKEEQKKKKILSDLSLSNNRYSRVELDGTSFKAGRCAVRLQGQFAYGLIQQILSDGQRTFFQLQHLHIIQFHPRFHARQVILAHHQYLVAASEVCLLHALPIWTCAGTVEPLYISDRTSDLSFYL